MEDSFLFPQAQLRGRYLRDAIPGIRRGMCLWGKGGVGQPQASRSLNACAVEGWMPGWISKATYSLEPPEAFKRWPRDLGGHVPNVLLSL